VTKVMSVITDPKQMATYSSPEHIAEVVYEAATDGRSTPLYCWRRRKGDVRNALAAWG
jgi:hypothetical protein